MDQFKYNIGNNVFFLQYGAITQGKISNSSSRAFGGNTYYIVNSQQYGSWFYEIEIFTTKEELIDAIIKSLGFKFPRQASVGFIIKNGLILAVSRKNDPTKFGVVGGGIEVLKGELPDQAFIRESKEETGITISQCELIWGNLEKSSRPGGDDVYSYCFFATQWEGEPQQQIDEGEIKWMTVAEITAADSAFPIYNAKAIDILKKLHPEIELK